MTASPATVRSEEDTRKDSELIACGERSFAEHPQCGLMAVAEKPDVVQIYKSEDSTRFNKAGTNASWQLVETRDLPARTGIRSRISSMEFSPDGRRLFVATTGRDALTTFELDAAGHVLSQSCTPPATFKV